MKLAIITTHPIQYNAPFFKGLASMSELELKVFYTWGEGVIAGKFDPGFQRKVNWDLPLLAGYQYEFVHNTAANPGSHHFLGIKNPTLISQLEQFAPDMMLVYGWSFWSHLNIMRHFKGKLPVLFRGDSTLIDDIAGFSLKKILRYTILRWVYRQVDFALYPGKASRAYFLKVGLSENQLIHVPHAVDGERFSENDAERKNEALAKRIEWGIPEKARVFLFVGKLESKKAPDRLLDAFITLNNKSVHLVFAGTGPLEEMLKQKAKQCTLSLNIHFIGFCNQQQMPVIYRVGNVLVLPSSGPGETWGLAVNEAMHCGIPAIVSNKVGCYEDLIEPGLSGNYFVWNNSDQLIKQLEFFANLSPEEFLLYKQSVTQKIGEYSLSKAIDLTFSLLQKINRETKQ